VIWVRGEHAAGAAFGHTLIDLEPHASAVVVLDHHGSATYAGKVAQDAECQDLDERLGPRCRLVRRRGSSR
jgi:hypothetical protein